MVWLLQQSQARFFSFSLRWPEPVYMRVGYVFDPRFLEWTSQPISIIFRILNK